MISIYFENLQSELMDGMKYFGAEYGFVVISDKTGADITEKSRFLILSGNKWVDVRKVDFSKLTTGTVYKFLISNEGYYDEYFSLRIDWYQDELFINGNMRKKQ